MDTTAPTKGAAELETGTWAGRPLIAFGLRSATVVVPLGASWVATRLAAPAFWHPAHMVGALVWIAQLIVVGSAAALLAGRASRRLLPLAALYKLSIAFPDRAPSRFRIALRSGNVKRMQAQFDDVRANGFGADQNETIVRILELVETLSRHERLTRGHTDRVRAYTDLIAEELGIDPDERDKLRWASMLHDIGKLAVPAEILNKPGKPTEEEWAILSSHPLIGGEIVEPLAGWLGEWRFVTSQHHERWDGTGYPNKLAGEQISLAGRIVAVADAYDVITSARSYKKPMSAATARKELVRCSGTQFDPAVVRAFLNVSIGRTSTRSGMLGWLIELPRGLASVAGQATSAAGGVVAASAVAAAAAVVVVPPAAPSSAVADTYEFAQPAALGTTGPTALQAARSVAPTSVTTARPERAIDDAPNDVIATTTTASITPTTNGATQTPVAPTSTTSTTTTVGPTTSTVPTTTTSAPAVSTLGVTLTNPQFTNGWSCSVAVGVRDANSAPVTDATVSVLVEGRKAGGGVIVSVTITSTTDGQGNATVAYAGTGRVVKTARFTVTGVVAAGYTWDGAQTQIST